jgi:hypothetical protein
MFGYGLLVGLILGVPAGVMIIALCNAAGEADERAGYDEEQM